MTAKGDVSNGSRSRKDWWDELAQIIVEFGARFLCGDFNMGLFSVIPELRARGFQINLAAWYCWQQNLETHVRADSCGMFFIGPCQGIRICLCPSLCGISVDPRPEKCSMVMETICNSEGKQTQQRPHSLPTYDFVGQGYPLTSYRPTEPDQQMVFLKWTFTVALSSLSSVVTENVRNAVDNRRWFPFRVDTTIGRESWQWPVLPVFKQKLVSIDLFDPQKEFFKRGAHMPLMSFMGGSQDTRRTQGALRRRAVKASLRGFAVERRQPLQPKAEGKSDGREDPEGKGNGGGPPVVAGYWEKHHPWQWIGQLRDGTPNSFDSGASSTGWSSYSWYTHGGGVSTAVVQNTDI
jgi:hypothetical protein